MSNNSDFVSGVVWLIVGFNVIYWADEAWNSHWLYKLWYQVTEDMLYVPSKPIDCDFLAAPIGRKGCHYEKTEAITKIGLSQDGKTPMMSEDGGKTWHPFAIDPNQVIPRTPKVTSVIVGWNKVGD